MQHNRHERTPGHLTRNSTASGDLSPRHAHQRRTLDACRRLIKPQRFRPPDQLRKQHVFARRVAQLDTILDYMDHWVAAKPDKCFSAFLDRHGNPRETYTYQSFEARTRFLAEYIHDETALQRGDRVALVYPPGLEMVASFVACARMGVIPVPIPPVTSVAKGGASRLRSVMLDSQASDLRKRLAFRRSGPRLP